MNTPLKLVSHALCPYVQRAAIVLAEKGVPFERHDVDLSAKPAWFTAISPLGKTPVLLVGDAALFESAVICEYLDETLEPRLHPLDPLARARHRAWVEYASALLNDVGAFYNADAEGFEPRRLALRARFERLESELDHVGPWFAGRDFGLVDAAFAPVFRYWEAFDSIGDFGSFDALPRVQAWREALRARASVRGAAAPGYANLLREFIERRCRHLGTLSRAAQTVLA